MSSESRIRLRPTRRGEVSPSTNYRKAELLTFVLGSHHGSTQPQRSPTLRRTIAHRVLCPGRLEGNHPPGTQCGTAVLYYSPDWLTGPGHDTSNFSKFSAFTQPRHLCAAGWQLQNRCKRTPNYHGRNRCKSQNGWFSPSTPGVPRGFYNFNAVHMAPELGLLCSHGDGRTSIQCRLWDRLHAHPFQIVNAFGSTPGRHER